METPFTPWASAAEGGTLLRLYVQPGASKSGWAGEFGEPARLKLRIQSPPVDGAANQAVVEFVADWAGVKRSEVRLIRGEKSRQKDLWLPLSPERVMKLQRAER